ncbi:MAG: hypothetical protein OEZ30_08920 [Candidatus Aminicenantes bacterium]|nr:hypothetical protein [Candidatus Aminicenantes bacterium]MDH5715671.1 hypothetical protein [Candidatus Aminicenantes bacterium]
MNVWCLDKWDEDDYIEKMTYPNCSIVLDCNYGSCDAGTSSWKNPTSWDSKQKIDAKIRLKVTGSELIWEYP